MIRGACMPAGGPEAPISASRLFSLRSAPVMLVSTGDREFAVRIGLNVTATTYAEAATYALDGIGACHPLTLGVTNLGTGTAKIVQIDDEQDETR
jgi:hypothetical protein